MTIAATGIYLGRDGQFLQYGNARASASYAHESSNERIGQTEYRSLAEQQNASDRVSRNKRISEAALENEPISAPIKGFTIFVPLKECQSGYSAIDHIEAISSRAESWTSGHSKNIECECNSVDIELQPLFSGVRRITSKNH